MTGDELCALLGRSRADESVQRALEVCVEIEIDEDGDGFAEAMDAHGYQVDFTDGEVVCVQLIREHYTGALPLGLQWDIEPTLPVLASDDDSTTYDAGDYQLKLVRDEGDVSALVAYPKD